MRCQRRNERDGRTRKDHHDVEAPDTPTIDGLAPVVGLTDLFADPDCPVLGHGGLSGVADVRVCSTAPCWWIRGVLLLAVVRVQPHGVSPQ